MLRPPSATVGYLVSFVALVVLGRLTVPPGTDLALFWPAAGVAMVWVLRSRTLPDLGLALGLILVVSTAGNHLTGVDDLAYALVLGVGNAAMAVAGRIVFAHLQGCRTVTRVVPARIGAVRDVGVLCAAALAGAALAAAVGAVGGLLTGVTVTLDQGIAALVRNSVGAISLAGPLLALGTGRSPGVTTHGWRTVVMELAAVAGRRSELLALALTTGLVAHLVFGAGRELPLAFLPFVLVAWSGVRFPPFVASVHALAVGLSALGLTLLVDGGPFGAVGEKFQQALVVQAFIGLAVVLSLTLTLSVHERDQLAARLADTEHRARGRADLMDAITDSMLDGLVVMDSRGTVLVHNRAAAVTLGATDEEDFDDLDLISDEGFRRLDGTPLARHERPSVRALRGQQVWGEELLHVDPATGVRRTLSVNAAPLLRPDMDELPLAVLLLRDVTHHHQQMRQLQGFAGVVAHDLQNPLAGIKGWADLLSEQLDQEQLPAGSRLRGSLARVQNGAQRMQALINDLLDYTRAGTADLKTTRVSLGDLLDAVTQELHQSHPDLTFTVEHDVHCDAAVDATAVRQLFANLLGNAVKYVADGVVPQVRISAGECEGRLHVRVSDNGIGVPEAERHRVFDAFHRSHQHYPGTGLGLAICAQAVERHGGTISVVDNEDRPGSTFAFSLPAWPTGAVAPTVQTAGDHRTHALAGAVAAVVASEAASAVDTDLGTGIGTGIGAREASVRGTRAS